MESTETVEMVLEDTFPEILALPLTPIIAPNTFIPMSFNSIEAVIAKNFIRKTKKIFHRKGDNRQVSTTLAVDRIALIDQRGFQAFLNDITALESPPDGFYVIAGCWVLDDSKELTRPEIIHANVIAGWMLLNYTLSLNGFKAINGFSDSTARGLCLGSIGLHGRGVCKVIIWPFSAEKPQRPTLMALKVLI